MRATRTRDLTTAALVTALLAASAFVSIPLQPVPVTFQTFVVVLAALLLAPPSAAAAVLAYLVLGAAGVPVFAGARGGLGVLLGPTGGFLVGFLAGAAAGAFVRVRAGRLPAVAADGLAAATAIVVTYLSGWAWLAYGPATRLGAAKALAAGVLPFLPLDALKVLGALLVAAALRRAGLARRP